MSNLAKKEMIKDPYFFLNKKPIFIKGKIPYDGITKNREIIAEKTKSIMKAKGVGKFYSSYIGHNIRDIKEIEVDLKIINKNFKD